LRRRPSSLTGLNAVGPVREEVTLPGGNTHSITELQQRHSNIRARLEGIKAALKSYARQEYQLAREADDLEYVFADERADLYKQAISQCDHVLGTLELILEREAEHQELRGH
jgi:hypothetical protein